MEKNFKSTTNQRLKFKAVDMSDAKILYELLNNRAYNISHSNETSFEDHLTFIKNTPYLHWYLISTNIPIGTFYILENNSIGLNIKIQSEEIVSQIINFIKNNFTPQKPFASKVPSYFYINTPIRNTNMIKLLEKNNLISIQITHKINAKGK